MFGAFLAACLTLPAGAQTTDPQTADAQNNSRLGPPMPNLATSPATQTGKERLGRKWMDEQRIDNCNVPIDKRGSKPRSSTCPQFR